MSDKFEVLDRSSMYPIDSPLANDEVEMMSDCDNVGYPCGVRCCGWISRQVELELGGCILETGLWSCVTEGLSPAAADKAREGAYCVRIASHGCCCGEEELEEFSKYH